jgi:hypothetical protein
MRLRTPIPLYVTLKKKHSLTKRDSFMPSLHTYGILRYVRRSPKPIFPFVFARSNRFSLAPLNLLSFFVRFFQPFIEKRGENIQIQNPVPQTLLFFWNFLLLSAALLTVGLVCRFRPAVSLAPGTSGTTGQTRSLALPQTTSSGPFSRKRERNRIVDWTIVTIL